MDTKVCKGPTCRDESGNGKEKLIKEFYRDRAQKDGRSPYCRDCHSYYKKKRYRTPEGRKVKMDYNKKFYQTEAGKKSRKRSYWAMVSKYPNRRKARAAVNNAIAKDRLPRASTHQCSYPGCKKQARQYHHHSYRPEHWLDVTPYCVKHHAVIDQEMIQNEGVETD